jgi:two-component system sensor histidine kinase EvgS
VVDDHPINRMVMLKQLQALGYAAEVAENGREALRMWTVGGFGTIITDCNMPELSGYELARQIRAIEARKGLGHTPIIACTANALGGEAESCFDAGMDDYLSKPISRERLAQKLDQWLPLGGKARANPGSPGAPGKPSSMDVIDRSALSDFSNGDAAVERDLLTRLRRYNAADAQGLMKAVEKRDIDGIAHAAQRIKGASKTVGGTRLAVVCERLERASRANDWNTVLSSMEAIQVEFARLDSHIAALEAEAKTDPQLVKAAV